MAPLKRLDSAASLEWRTNDLVKPLDADGDSVYGTDGYFVAIDGDHYMAPAYATVTIIPELPGGNPELWDGAQAVLDDPTMTGPADVNDIVCGDWLLNTEADEVDFFSIRLNADIETTVFAGNSRTLPQNIARRA